MTITIVCSRKSQYGFFNTVIDPQTVSRLLHKNLTYFQREESKVLNWLFSIASFVKCEEFKFEINCGYPQNRRTIKIITKYVPLTDNCYKTDKDHIILEDFAIIHLSLIDL